MPHDELAPLLPLPPEDRLRLPSDDERLEVSSSGEDNAADTVKHLALLDGHYYNM